MFRSRIWWEFCPVSPIKIPTSGYLLGQFYSPFTLIIYFNFNALLRSGSKRQLKVVHSPTVVFNRSFIISFPSTPSSSNFSVPYRFSYQALYTPLIPPTLHPPLFSYSVTLTILNNKFELRVYLKLSFCTWRYALSLLWPWQSLKSPLWEPQILHSLFTFLQLPCTSSLLFHIFFLAPCF